MTAHLPSATAHTRLAETTDVYEDFDEVTLLPLEDDGRGKN